MSIYQHPATVTSTFCSVCRLKHVDEDVGTTRGVDVGGESSSRVFQEYVQCSMVVSSVDPNFSGPLVPYRGEDAAEKFVRDLQQEAKQLFDEYSKTSKPMMFTATECIG